MLDMRSHSMQQIGFKTLIGADGANSCIRRIAAGRRPKVRASIQTEVPVFNQEMILDFQHEGRGYSWYIPHKETAMIGFMSWSCDTQLARARLVEELSRYETKYQLLNQTFLTSFIPTGNDVLLEYDGVYFVGDAAGLATPKTGAGIRLALESAVKLYLALSENKSYESLLGRELAYLETESYF